MQPAWLLSNKQKMNAESQCVWNQSLVLFITFEAIALTTIPASWCPLHDLNVKKQRSLSLGRSCRALQKHMCFLSFPRTSKFGYTEHTSIVESGQIWCYDLWRESRTYFAGRAACRFWSVVLSYYKTEDLLKLGSNYLLYSVQTWDWILQKSLGTEKSQFWASISAK